MLNTHRSINSYFAQEFKILGSEEIQWFCCKLYKCSDAPFPDRKKEFGRVWNPSFSAICDLREFFARIDFIGAASRLHCLFWSKEPFLGLIGLVVGPSLFNSRKEPPKVALLTGNGAQSWKEERLSLNFEIELSVAVDSFPFFALTLFPIHWSFLKIDFFF